MPKSALEAISRWNPFSACFLTVAGLACRIVCDRTVSTSIPRLHTDPSVCGRRSAGRGRLPDGRHHQDDAGRAAGRRSPRGELQHERRPPIAAAVAPAVAPDVAPAAPSGTMTGAWRGPDQPGRRPAVSGGAALFAEPMCFCYPHADMRPNTTSDILCRYRARMRRSVSK